MQKLAVAIISEISVDLAYSLVFVSIWLSTFSQVRVLRAQGRIVSPSWILLRDGTFPSASHRNNRGV